MERFTGLIGIAFIIFICYLMSNNKKKINLKTVITGFLLQFGLAVFVLKIKFGQDIINIISKGIEKVLHFSNAGADFVFGFLNDSPEKIDAMFYTGASFVFSIKLIATLIFI